MVLMSKVALVFDEEKGNLPGLLSSGNIVYSSVPRVDFYIVICQSSFCRALEILPYFRTISHTWMPIVFTGTGRGPVK
jgi:hypothetical protein